MVVMNVIVMKEDVNIMSRITIKELEKHIGEEVEVQGFIANIRDLQ
mgnify:FL=1